MTTNPKQGPMRGEVTEPKSKALYQVKLTSFINGQILSPGEEVVYDGFPGANLIPINAAAKAMAAEYKELKAVKDEGEDAAERYQARVTRLQEAADKHQKPDPETDGLLPEADPELLKHAEQTRTDTAEAAKADPDVHGVKMSGEQTNTAKASTDNTPDDKSKPDAAKAK